MRLYLTYNPNDPYVGAVVAAKSEKTLNKICYDIYHNTDTQCQEIGLAINNLEEGVVIINNCYTTL